MATRIFWRQTKRGVRLCVRDRHGHESWKRLGTVTDIEVGKKIALTAEGVVRRIGIEQERGEVVLALDKVIALPGRKVVV